MRTYEFISIFSTKEDNYAVGLKAVKDLLQKNGVEISSEEDMGDRLLAYPIKKEDRGHYQLFVMNAAPESLIKIDEDLKLTPSVLKSLFVKKEN
ncbi:MAG: 30S ribosomal protein S6 [Spirochaetaceae bacterium]|jgi:small subunit ribosomal protein S6|nr:30S ribosomal protein S6 [Spirochaetaceae bacterium]